MGAQTEYTYKRRGITQSMLNAVMPGTGTTGQQVPPTYHGVTWDADFKDDLDQVLAAEGWEFLWEGPPPSALTIAQIQNVVLASDGSSIAPADGWVTVATKTIDTSGGSTISAQISALSNSNGAGQPHMRLLVNCPGVFTDVVVGAAQYDLVTSDHGGRSFSAPRPIADTAPTIKTYTFTLQYSVTGIGSTIQALIGTQVGLVEYRA